MATHSSILAWRIPGTGEPDGLPSMGSHRVGHNWSDLTAAAFHMEMETSIVPLLLLYSFVYIYRNSSFIHTHTRMHAKSLQSCPTLDNPVDCSLPGSSIHGILQARILEWVAMPSSRGFPEPGTKPEFLMSPALTGGFFTASTTWDVWYIHVYVLLFLKSNMW